MPDNVITLVHGTFAGKTDWIAPDGDFARSLGAKLKVDTTFHEFRWSGGNSHFARLAAGAALKRQLESQARQNPGARQYVIAHSHGGNVAAYATRDWDRRLAAPKAVFSLATPYLSVEPVGERVVVPVVLSTLIGSSVLVGMLAGAIDAHWDTGVWLLPVLIPLCFLALFIVGLGLVKGLGRAVRRASLINIDFARHPVHLVSLRLSRDEARGWLAVVLFLSSLPERGASLMGAFQANALAFLGALVIVPGVLLSIAAAIESTMPEAASWFGQTGSAFALASFAALAIGLPLFLISGLGAWLGRGQVTGLGEHLFDSLFLRVRLLQDVVSGVQVSPGAGMRRGLRHSQIYRLAATEDFIAERINGWRLYFAKSPRANAEQLDALDEQQRRLGAD